MSLSGFPSLIQMPILRLQCPLFVWVAITWQGGDWGSEWCYLAPAQCHPVCLGCVSCCTACSCTEALSPSPRRERLVSADTLPLRIKMSERSNVN